MSVATSKPLLELYNSFARYSTTTVTLSILVISVNGMNVTPLVMLTGTILESLPPTFTDKLPVVTKFPLTLSVTLTFITTLPTVVFTIPTVVFVGIRFTVNSLVALVIGSIVLFPMYVALTFLTP